MRIAQKRKCDSRLAKVETFKNSSDIPAGSLPISIDVILRGKIVNFSMPKDKAIFTGKLVVVPDIV